MKEDLTFDLHGYGGMQTFIQPSCVGMLRPQDAFGLRRKEKTQSRVCTGKGYHFKGFFGSLFW